MAPGVFEKLLSKNGHFRKFQKILLLEAPPVSNPNVVPDARYWACLVGLGHLGRKMLSQAQSSKVKA